MVTRILALVCAAFLSQSAFASERAAGVVVVDSDASCKIVWGRGTDNIQCSTGLL